MLLSFWLETEAVYTHRLNGITLPFSISGRDNALDIGKARPPEAGATVHALLQSFDYAGLTENVTTTGNGNMFVDNLKRIFSLIDSETQIFVVLACERVYDADGIPSPVHHFVNQNTWVRQAAKDFGNVRLLSIEDAVSKPADIIDATHFDRRVYFNIYRHMTTMLDV